MSFIGRERELVDCAQLVHAGRILLIRGAPGVGKSALVEELVLREGWTTHWVRAAEQEGGPPSDVVVFDLANGPPPAMLLQRARDAGHAVVVTSTSGFDHSLPHEHYELGGLEIRSQGGERSDAIRLFVEELGAEPGPGALATIADLARLVEGHPQALLDLARSARTLGLDETAARTDRLASLLSPGLREAYAKLAAPLKEHEKAVLAAAKAFRGPFAFGDLERVVDAPIVDAVQQLRESNLLVGAGGKLSMPALVEMVGPGDLAAEGQKRLSDLVEEVAENYAEVACNLPPAAVASRRRFSPALVAWVLERRRTSVEVDHPRVLALLALLGDDIHRATPAVRKRLEEMLSERELPIHDVPPLLLRAHVGIAYSLARRDVAAARAALARAESSDTTHAGVVQLSRLLRLQLDAPAVADLEGELLALADEATRSENRVLGAQATIHAVYAAAAKGNGARALELAARALLLAERSDNDEFLAQTRLSLANALFSLGEVEGARRIVLASRGARALDSNDSYVQAYLATLEGLIAFVDGKMEPSVAASRAALAACAVSTGSEALAGPPLTCLGLAYCQQGRWDEALEAFEESRRIFSSYSLGHGATLLALFGAAVAADRLQLEPDRSARAAELATSGVNDEGSTVLLRLLSDRGESALQAARAYAQRELGPVVFGTFHFERFAKAVLLSLVAGAAPSSVETIEVFGAGELVRIGDRTIDLSRQPMLRRLFYKLAVLHQEAPERSLSLEELGAAVWEGQKISHGALKNRLHVALSRLRRLGLPRAFEASDERVRLSGLVAIKFVAA